MRETEKDEETLNVEAVQVDVSDDPCTRRIWSRHWHFLFLPFLSLQFQFIDLLKSERDTDSKRSMGTPERCRYMIILVRAVSNQQPPIKLISQQFW